MTDTKDFTIFIGGAELVDKNIQRLNEVIKLEEQILSAKESIKDYYNAIADDVCGIDDNIKPAQVKKQAASIIKEHLDAKITAQMEEGEAVLDAYSLVKGKLL